MTNVDSQALLDLRDLIEKTTGIYYLDSSLPLLRDRLGARISALRLKDLVDYYYYLKWDPRRQGEWESLLAYLTVNETHFWRESDALEWALEKIRSAAREGRRCKVWHAACSSGEEPYSLAMAAMNDGLVPWVDFELIASDLDPQILSHALQARYSPHSLRNLPEAMRERYILEGEKSSLLSPEVRAAVRFFRLNLHETKVPWPQDMDLIFCRNVFIYFRPSTVQQIAHRFSRSLKSRGHLLLGAAESLLQLETPFEFLSQNGVIIYRNEDRS